MNTCLITGSARRLGKSLAIGFAKKGWNIILHYNQSNPKNVIDEINALGVNVFPVKFDLQKSEEIIAAFELIKKNFFYPNVMINNAAIFPPRKSLANITDEEWDSVMNINLRSVFLTSREFSKDAPEGSRIINIASVGAHKIWKERIAYNVSKSALVTLTKVLARDLAPKISVNSVSPGYIKFNNDDSEEFISSDHIPKIRYSLPEEIFEIVFFLSTSTDYITGQDIRVDGGLGLL